MAEQRRKAERCPVCGKAVTAELRPFCSRRCADVDLGRWLIGHYRIEGAEDEADEADSDDSA